MGKRRKKSKVYRVRSARVRRDDEQEHYVDPLTNLKDGLDQERRRSAELTAPFEPTRVEPAVEAKFLEELEATGGEKLCGMGTIGHYDLSEVGVSKAALGLTKEEFESRRLRFHEERWYWRSSGKGERKRAWPGLLRHTLTFAPWFDRTIKRALREGAVGAPAFEEFLRRLLAEMPALIEEATRFGGARRGVETLLAMTHYQQSVVHVHPYFADVGSDHERIGHFSGTKKARLVLAGLGPAGVGADRQERVGLLPIPRRDEDGNIVADWKALQWNIADRATKMGDEARLPWDLAVSRWLDERLDAWARANPAVSRILDEEVEEERRANLAEVSLRREELRLEAAEEAEKKAAEAKAAAEDARKKAEEAQQVVALREVDVITREAAVGQADKELAAAEVRIRLGEAAVEESLRAAREAAAQAEKKLLAAQASRAAADLTRLKAEEELRSSRLLRETAAIDMQLRQQHLRAIRNANEAYGRIVAKSHVGEFSYLIREKWPLARINRLLRVCEGFLTSTKEDVPAEFSACFARQNLRVVSHTINELTRKELMALRALHQDNEPAVVAAVDKVFAVVSDFDLVLPSEAALKTLCEAFALLVDRKPVTQTHVDVVTDEALRRAIYVYSRPRAREWKQQMAFGLTNLYLEASDWLSKFTSEERKRRDREIERGAALGDARNAGAENALAFEEQRSRVVGDDEFDRFRYADSDGATVAGATAEQPENLPDCPLGSSQRQK